MNKPIKVICDTMTWTMALVQGNEDVVVIAGDHCQKCAQRKLQVLKHFAVDKDEVQRLVKWGVKVVKVRDDCA